MTNTSRNFDSQQAGFLVKNGLGVLIKTSEMSDQQVGFGIYHELWRDYEWLYISAVTHGPAGVTIEYLEMATTRSHSRGEDAATTIEITEERIVKRSETFAPGEQILFSANQSLRPKGRRITTVTSRTTIEEPLDD